MRILQIPSAGPAVMPFGACCLRQSSYDTIYMAHIARHAHRLILGAIFCPLV